MKHQRRTMIRGACHAAVLLVCGLAQAAPLEIRHFRTATFSLALRADTQALVSLAPLAERNFDFLPADRATERRNAGHYHLGDLTLRLRTAPGEWRDFSTNDARISVRTHPAGGDTLAAADITASLGSGLPLLVERRWHRDGRALALSFTLTNNTDAP